MFTYKSMHLQNYVLFDDVTLDLDYNGITVVNGLNKNAMQKNGQKRMNGAGKSLLTSAIPNLWYGVDPTVTTTKSRAKYDAFYRKGASSTFEIEKDGKEVKITKLLKGKSLRYEVNYNGKDLNHTTAKAAESWLESFFPLTEEQFYSTVYLDARRPGFSLIGQGAQRFNFFSNLFSLDAYDSLKDHFDSVRKELKHQKSQLSVYADEYAEAKTQYDSLKKQIGDKTSEWVAGVYKSLEKKRKRLFALEQARKKLESIQNTSDIEYDEAKEKKLISLAKEIEKSLSAHELYEEWQDQADEKITQQKTLSEKIEELIPLLNVEEEFMPKQSIENRVALAKSYISTSEKFLVDVKENEAKFEKKKKVVKHIKQVQNRLRVPKNAKTLAQLQKKQSKLSVLVDSLQDQLKKLRKNKFDGGKCPTCGSEVDVEHIEKEIVITEKKLKESQNELVATNIDVDALQIYLSLKEEYLKLETVKPVSENSVESVQNRIKLLKDFIRLSNEYSAIFIPSKPSNAVKLKDPDSTKAKLDKVQKNLKKLAIAKQRSSTLNELKELGFDDIEQVEKELKEIDTLFIEAQQKEAMQIENAIEKLSDVVTRLKRLKKRIKDIETSLSQVKIIEALSAAYGNSGLKRYACAEIANRVQNNINEVSSLIFAEKYKFHFEVTQTDFKILFEDKRGVFDVRNLSGAESRSFTVLSMLGILPLLPSSMRSNLLILDEMDANLDPTAQKMFCNDLIPALNEIIPHIIVVTPLSSVYPDARTCLVTKSGKTSTLSIV